MMWGENHGEISDEASGLGGPDCMVCADADLFSDESDAGKSVLFG